MVDDAVGSGFNAVLLYIPDCTALYTAHEGLSLPKLFNVCRDLSCKVDWP